MHATLFQGLSLVRWWLRRQCDTRVHRRGVRKKAHRDPREGLLPSEPLPRGPAAARPHKKKLNPYNCVVWRTVQQGKRGKAMPAQPESTARILERSRAYLDCLTYTQVDPRLWRRFGWS